VVTSFDHTRAQVGDVLRYTVRVDHDPAVEVVFPEFPETIAGLSVRNFGPLRKRTEAGRVVVSRWYDLSHFIAGSYTVPGVAVEYRLPGKPKAMLRSASMFVEIESIVGEELGSIRDIVDPLAASSRYTKYYLWAGLGLVAAGAAVVGLVLYRRRRARRRILGPPPVPAHELAYALLEQLLQEDLIGAGQIKLFYYRLSNIVRHYIENRFHLMAPERTTEEFLVEMAVSSRLTDAHKGLISTFLDHCDLVKFAKYAPGEKEISGAYDSAVRFIDETREPAGAAPVPHESDGDAQGGCQ